MEPALESFQEYFLRSLELRGASLEAEAEGAVGGREMFVKFVADYQNQIHQQRVTRSLTLGGSRCEFRTEFAARSIEKKSTKWPEKFPPI
ncbi:MAG: hypothetical protein IPJ71_19220 [Bdellovibrionales bacterium]|nr:hypothetical protein [Bdellovibrionales bacterium]